MFRLLRFFSIASLAAFVVVSLVLGFWYRELAVNDLIEQEESKNVALTKAFSNSLWSQVMPYLATSAEFDVRELRADPAILDIRSSVLGQMEGLSVVKVKIYDLQGRAVFSTELAQIGDDDSANAGFQGAIAGGVASELTHRDTFSAFEGEIENRDVLSTYIPFRANRQTGEILGVFELYSDVTPLLRKVHTTQRQIMVGVALILGALYLGLFFIVRHADQTIRQQAEETKRVYQELTQQQRALAMLQERERLARELHDSLGQILGFINVQTQAARQLLARGKSKESDQLLSRLTEVVQDAHTDVREQILNLRSGASSENDLVSMLEDYLKQFSTFSNIKVELHGAEQLTNVEMGPSVEIQLLRIIQEALTNVRKHAKAHSARVNIQVEDGVAHVTVQDDGQGFDPSRSTSEAGYHVGLHVMRERAEELGGNLEIESQPGRGARVRIAVPLFPKLALQLL